MYFCDFFQLMISVWVNSIYSVIKLNEDRKGHLVSGWGHLCMGIFNRDYIPSIEVLPFWNPPTPREIRLKKLNVSPTLYCNVLPLTVYFIGKLMYWQNLPLFDTWINIANWRPGTYSVFRHGRIRHLPPPCRFGGVPVHHDPVHGIVTNPRNREWGQSPLSFFVVCDNPMHRVMHGELGTPHFPGYTPAWWNPKL